MSLNIHRITPTKQLIFAVTAVFAFVLQPMLSLNIPAAFAANPTELKTTDLTSGGWTLGESRSAGHSVIVSGGLHVWTTPSDCNGATPPVCGNSLSKAAGYYNSVNFPLADAGDASIDIRPGFTGVRPSLQLGVDRDGDGHWDGYLVYEPWAYGDGQFWVDKPGFGVSAGMGYASFGTIAQYVSANPQARVISVGYSLGSGVVGDSIINSLTVAGVKYTFDTPKVAQNNRTGEEFETLQSAIDSTSTVAGDTITLLSDIVTNEQTTINKNNVTINGNNHTIYPSFTKTDNDNNSALAIQASDVQVNDLVIDGKDGVKLHGVNVWHTNGWSTLYNVTVKNNKYSGINVGEQSQMRVVNVKTSNNGWNAIDVDKSGSELWMGGGTSNQFNENPGVPAIYVDDIAVGQVKLDNPGLYTFVDKPGFPNGNHNDRAYYMKPATPTNLTWTGQGGESSINDGFTNVKKGTLSWQVSNPDNVDHYIYKFWTNISGYHNDSNDSWSTEGSQYVTKTATGGSVWTDFADKDGTYYFCVTAVSNSGIKSDCSATYSVTYDSTKSKITLVTPSEPVSGNWFNLTGSVYDTNFSYYYCVLEGHDGARVLNHGCVTTWAEGTQFRPDNWKTEYKTGTVQSAGDTTPSLLGQLNIEGLPSGDYTAYLVAYDLAGNSNVLNPVKVNFTIDRTAPISFTASIDKQGGTNTSRTFSGNTQPGSTVSVEVHSTPKSLPASVDAYGNWTVTFDDLDVGPHTAYITATDSYGNSSTKEMSFSVDKEQSQSQEPTSNGGITPQDRINSNSGPLGTTPQLAFVPTGSVLGDQTDTPNSDTTPKPSDTSVKGDSDVKPAENVAAIKTTNGFAWYWWVIALAVVGFAWWMIAAARRRRATDDI